MDPVPKGTSDDGLDEAFAEPRGLGFDGPAPTIDELLANEDAAGLLELGAAYRVGTPHAPRDLFKALECFEAASRLGSEQAEYLVALAYMNGLGIGRDVAEGAKRMRSAAQRGSLRAKVYVANLYELGVHYAPDRDKADVWYRNVARAAGIDADPESDAYELAMAEHGCVRFCLRLVADEDLPAKDRAFYLKKAKAMGYAHRLADARASEAPPAADPTQASAPPRAAPPADAEAEAEPAPAEPAREEAPAPPEPEPEDDDDPAAYTPTLGAQWTFGAGAAAFLVAAFFAASGAVAAFLAHEGSRSLALAGRALPVVGRTHEVVLFGVLFLAGVLPAGAVYRPNVIAVGTLVGAAAGAGGWFAFPSYPLLWDAAAQAGAAGLIGFLATALVLGMLGGTRRPIDPPAT